MILPATPCGTSLSNETPGPETLTWNAPSSTTDSDVSPSSVGCAIAGTSSKCSHSPAGSGCNNPIIPGRLINVNMSSLLPRWNPENRGQVPVLWQCLAEYLQ